MALAGFKRGGLAWTLSKPIQGKAHSFSSSGLASLVGRQARHTKLESVPRQPTLPTKSPTSQALLLSLLINCGTASCFGKGGCNYWKALTRLGGGRRCWTGLQRQ